MPSLPFAECRLQQCAGLFGGVGPRQNSDIIDEACGGCVLVLGTAVEQIGVVEEIEDRRQGRALGFSCSQFVWFRLEAVYAEVRLSLSKEICHPWHRLLVHPSLSQIVE